MKAEKDRMDARASKYADDALVALARSTFQAHAKELPDDIVRRLAAARAEAVAICEKLRATHESQR